MIKSFFTAKYWISTFLLVLFGVTIVVFNLFISTHVIQMLEAGNSFKEVILFVVISGLLLLTIKMCFNLIDEYLNRYILKKRFDLLVEIELACNKIPYAHNFQSKINDMINIVEKFFSNQTELHDLLDNFNAMLINVVTLIIYLVVITKLNLIVLVVITTYLLVCSTVSMKLKHKITKLHIDSSRCVRQLDYYTNLLTNYKTREQVYASKFDTLIKEKYATTCDHLLVINKKINNYQVLNSLLLGPSKYLIVLLIVVIYALSSNQPQVSDMWLVVQAFLGVAVMLQAIIDFVTSLQGTKGIRTKIKEYEAMELNEYEEVKAPVFESLEFDKVSFTYNDKLILDNCSFKINCGESYALVGKNGSGKTTITNLILKLYKPTSGKILLNGIDLQLYSDNEIRNIFSVVFQNSVLYPLTYEENITLSNKTVDDDIFAQMENYLGSIKKYKDKRNIQVLKGISNQSLDLSGGEKQQLAIARAMYQNHQFVIFDEPTSSLDPKSELKYYQMFKSIFEDKTMIMITHRMGGCKLVDNILFLDDKHIAESGSHQQLIDKQGLYNSFYTVQSQRFGGAND